MRTEPPLATVHPAWGPAQAVTAQSEAWLVHPSDDVAYLLSLIGSAHALDTIRRAFLEDTIALDLTPPRGLGRRLSALRSGAWHYRAWRGRLPSGAVHLVLAAARAPRRPGGPAPGPRPLGRGAACGLRRGPHPQGSIDGAPRLGPVALSAPRR